MTDQQWFTVREVSDKLKVHPETVREWLRVGKLKGHRISKRAGWRVTADELQQFMGGGDDAGKAPIDQ